MMGKKRIPLSFRDERKKVQKGVTEPRLDQHLLDTAYMGTRGQALQGCELLSSLFIDCVT